MHLLMQMLLMVVALLLPVVSGSDNQVVDPIDGSLVTTDHFHFDLENGQRIQFATSDALNTFLQEPKAALRGAVMVDFDGDETMSATALCPVCGMETAVHGGPQVVMQYGNQAIHTCSLFHARQVYDRILEFQDKEHPVVVPQAPQAYCSGPGTTMLNGFSSMWSSSGTTPCILLWFPGWVLRTRLWYIGGCVLVAGCAIFNEYLLHVRRMLRKEARKDRTRWYPPVSPPVKATEGSQLLQRSASQPIESFGHLYRWFRTLQPESQHAMHCGLHGLTILIAYLLMLVSMTYDSWLFLSTIAGYVVGHYWFGERRDVPTSTSSEIVASM